jgi:hypothetical protein
MRLTGQNYEVSETKRKNDKIDGYHTDPTPERDGLTSFYNSGFYLMHTVTYAR